MAKNVGKKQIQYFCDYCGEIIDLHVDDLLTYNRKYFHEDCLITKLKRARKHKFTPEEINEIIIDSREKGRITRNNGLGKGGKKSIPSVRLPKMNTTDFTKLNFLLDFLDGQYHFSKRDLGFVRKTLVSIENGTYSKTNGQKMPSDELYNMFTYYKLELDKIHARLKNPIENGRSMFYYDLAVIINKYDDYNRLVNANLKNEDNIQDFQVSNYLSHRNIEEDNSDDDIDLDAFLEGY